MYFDKFPQKTLFQACMRYIYVIYLCNVYDYFIFFNYYDNLLLFQWSRITIASVVSGCVIGVIASCGLDGCFNFLLGDNRD